MASPKKASTDAILAAMDAGHAEAKATSARRKAEARNAPEPTSRRGRPAVGRVQKTYSLDGETVIWLDEEELRRKREMPPSLATPGRIIDEAVAMLRKKLGR